MLPTCLNSNLKLYEIGEPTRDLAQKLSCSELTAAILEMSHENKFQDIERAREWLKPQFEELMNNLNLGASSYEAAKKWRSKNSFGNVVVYGDYDVDGVASTVLAMEIFRHKALGVRYFIPRRDTQGYGLHASILERLTEGGCNTLVVVDCGTNDFELLRSFEQKGLDVFVFDHHSVSKALTYFPPVINPCVDGDDTARKLCATAVLWSWAWKEEVVSRQWLSYMLDIVAMATISDCMPLNVLNRSIVQKGIELMKRNPRRGLAALFEKLGIAPHTISEEHLSMKIIPCLNAPGRIGCADLSVRALMGVGELHANVNDLIKSNKKRQVISERIASKVCEAESAGRYVMFDDTWPVGVLSGVASRICSARRSPVVLAAPIKDKIRGTVRVPAGGDAVGILSTISDQLEAWGGHRYAAGFSVSPDHWPDVEDRLEKLLSEIEVEEELIKAVALPPAEITLSDWKAAGDLGPFGNDNPRPYFYAAKNGSDKIVPLGKDGKHCSVLIDAVKNLKILAFNAAPDLKDTSDIVGWIYHPRIDHWRNEERVQFVLDYTVLAK